MGNFQILHFSSVSSTQEIAKMILRENVVVVADEQREGRGRKGRRWFSPYGGLWMTIILKDFNSQLLTLAAGIAVAKTLESFGVRSKIKWPNDIIIEGKKVAGILAEKHKDFVLLGIGVNLENEIPEEIKDLATNVRGVKREEFLLAFLEILEEEFKKNKENILKDWRDYECTLGKKVSVDDELVGIAADIDDDGFLILEVDGRRERITAGTLRFLE